MSRRNAATRALALALVAVASASCARSGFQYIENDQAGVYAKIPDDWEVVSEGPVDFALLGEDGTMSVLPGDSTFPWRAVFDAAPTAGPSTSRVLGAIEVQPVDRRLRSGLTVERLVGFDPQAPDADTTVLHQSDVIQGDLSGLRIIYETTGSGPPTMVDRLMLSDDRFTTVYDVRISCDTECFADNARLIDEIMETFTVEPS